MATGIAGHSTPGIMFLVVAAGQGLRAGDGLPKQYRLLGGRPMLAHTLRALRAAAPEAGILVVIHPDHAGLYAAAVAGIEGLLPPAFGGANRQASSLAGLERLAQDPPDIVLIHDAARPFVSPALVQRAIAAASRHSAAIPATAVTDTIKAVDGAGMVLSTPDRSSLRAVQTPQAFRFTSILAAHRACAESGETARSDDAAVSEHAGTKVHVFEGDPGNMKITTADDFATADTRLRANCQDVRTGQGYDVHAFGPGDHVWLGGIKIAHSHGLVGHSDADVVLHAITDAILGAIADGDIGAHFPPSDPQWRGAASAIFLVDAIARVRRLGGFVANIDATIVCEFPKIGPHRDAIRASVSAITGLELSRIAIKATTSERLGFTGRSEGMAALALATVRLPGA